VAAQRPDANRFGLLLLVLVATYLLSAFSSGLPITVLQVLLFGAVAILAARTSAMSRLHTRLAIATVLVGTAAMLAVASVSDAGKGVANIWFALILLATAFVIVHRILLWPAVTLQSIFGAISAYLILGLMFAAIFSAIDHLGGGHFFAHGESANTQTFQYFSFTTLTTLGYGDFTAAGASGRAVAILEALTGQIFLATLIARLVAAFRGPSDKR
jgi:Ion channel